MATPNYAYEKRQRELDKKRKKEQKLRRKTSPSNDLGPSDATEGSPDAVHAPADPATTNNSGAA